LPLNEDEVLTLDATHNVLQMLYKQGG